jgi:CRISPR-associated endonuclease Csn1
LLIVDFVPLTKEELFRWSKYQKGITKKFPENSNFKKWLACDFSYQDGITYKNPYELRVKALDEKLSKHELGRVLYHIVQRRGYKDIGETNKETETQISRRGISGFQEAIDQNRTIAEALMNEFLKKGKRARNEYPYRDEYELELEKILKAQSFSVSKNKEDKYDNSFVQNLWNAIIWQRPLKTQKGLIGKCTLEPTKLRCPISHPFYEISRAWQFINTIRIINNDGSKQELDLKLKKDLFVGLFLVKDDFKFEEIKNFINKKQPNKAKYNYPINEKSGKYDTHVSGLPFCNQLIKIWGENVKEAILNIHLHDIDKAPKIINGYSILDLWHAVFSFDEPYLQILSINKLGTSNIDLKRKGEIVSISPLVVLKRKLEKGYGDLSIKALKKIIPFLMEGFLYNEAVVFAKLPEMISGSWEDSKDKIYNIAKNNFDIYDNVKTINNITNKLIDIYKGLEYPNIYAYKDFNYTLKLDDKENIVKCCENYFGEITWNSYEKKQSILSEVEQAYQAFFNDSKRAYRITPSLTSLFEAELINNGFNLNGKLYHHSKRDNLYGHYIIDKNSGQNILPVPYIDSIKNPMFNKSLNILRRLINELILNDKIDEETEVTVEVANELNDNNKRVAIERYQNERRLKREKIKEFLEEFKTKENISFNTTERIRDFELWSEQIFDDTPENFGQKTKEIYQEKNELKRYELWMEQKGQCIYTGKMISISQLFSNDIEIEHTIPRSILPDNTMANLTVCFTKYNKDIKKNSIPYYCVNYNKDIAGIGTSIEPRLNSWKKIRDSYKALYLSRKKPFGNEDEMKKNKRIQEKHYFKMHLDYWFDKVERFTANEVNDSWARRQLVDTQMISKYAREFLKTYFKKVAVQKGSVTSDFRKIYGFQEADEIKSRNKNTHHAIDAAVLTLIPVNSSRRDEILNKMYDLWENERKQYTTKPFENFSSQKIIADIENNTLVVNYNKDKILQQSKRKLRKRNKIQYTTNETGQIVELKSQGDTVRANLFADTYLGKIKDVERDVFGKPIKNEKGFWKYKTGKDEFIFTKRKSLQEVLINLEDVIDQDLKNLIRSQIGKDEIVDFQGNPIRHVRIKTKAGKVVKERVNFLSKHDYKNYFYAESGSIPYAIMLQNTSNQITERKMIPVSSFEVAKVFKVCRKFDVNYYIKIFHPEYDSFKSKSLLHVGQKVIVLNSDEEFEFRKNQSFQRNRLYKITQFKYDGSKIMLLYHLEAMSKDKIDENVKTIKNIILQNKEKELGIPIIEENDSIVNSLERKIDFKKRVENFTDRLKIIEGMTSKEVANSIKSEIEKYKTESSKILIEGQTPILGLTNKNWNLLYEGYDFELNFLGEIKYL